MATPEPAARLRIGIAGIGGRMGRLLAEEVRAGAILAGGVGREPGPGRLAGIGDLAAIAEVVIDFTNAATVARHAEALAGAGVGWVLGTSGLTARDEAAVDAAAARIPVVHAANFAPGAVLMLALAERMAAALDPADYDAEIVEMHHRQKVDAPSGTALALGFAVARGRGTDPVLVSGRDGQTGQRPPDAIGLASLRGGQVVGEHTLIFAGASEHLSLSHRALDRRVFAVGAMRAALWLRGRPPGRYGMRDVLGLLP